MPPAQEDQCLLNPGSKRREIWCKCGEFQPVPRETTLPFCVLHFISSTTKLLVQRTDPEQRLQRGQGRPGVGARGVVSSGDRPKHISTTTLTGCARILSPLPPRPALCPPPHCSDYLLVPYTWLTTSPRHSTWFGVGGMFGRILLGEVGANSEPFPK